MLVALMISLTMSLISCNSCNKENNTGIDSTSTNEILEGLAIKVEHTVALDRQSIYNMIGGKDFMWYGTWIDLKYFMDTEEASAEIAGVTNLFQWVEEIDEKSFDVKVIESTWEENGKHTITTVPGFWVGVNDLSKDSIKLTFDDAFVKIMEAKIKKPHSKKCALIKDKNSENENPQYIFGDDDQIYVDAITGQITQVNQNQIGKPLGEWP